MCTIPRQLLPSVCGVKVYPHGLRCTLKLLTCLTFNDAAAVAEEELGVGVLVCEVKQPSAAADHSLSQVGLVQNFCWVSWRLCCRTLPALSGLSHEDEQTVRLNYFQLFSCCPSLCICPRVQDQCCQIPATCSGNQAVCQNVSV